MNKEVEENFKIVLEYIKDLSIETPSASTLLYVRENLNDYNMDIDISSSVLKNKSLEITTKLILRDKKNSKDKAFFEIKYVESEEVFYPLGKLQTFDLRCETMEYGGQIFATGNSKLDGYMAGLSLGVVSGNTDSGANNVAGSINFNIQQEFDAGKIKRNDVIAIQNAVRFR